MYLMKNNSIFPSQKINEQKEKKIKSYIAASINSPSTKEDSLWRQSLLTL